MPPRLVTDARDFLSQLAAENTRDWFQAHKTIYETTLRDPAKALLEALAPDLAELAGAPVETKLFRINRDVRFSKDKTPYNTHLHMMWTVKADARQDPAVFFGIGLDYVTVGTGLPEFGKDVLADWRRMVDLDGDRITARLAEAEKRGYGLSDWSPVLKRVPPPYPKDHPRGDLLRRKGLTVAGPPPEGDDLAAALRTAFADLWPVADLLIGIAEAPSL